MKKQEYRERIRKIKWASKKAGEKWGKKALGEAQKIVMEMTKTIEPKDSGQSSFKEKLPVNNLTRLSVDLSQLIGKDFKNGT